MYIFTKHNTQNVRNLEYRVIFEVRHFLSVRINNCNSHCYAFKRLSEILRTAVTLSIISLISAPITQEGLDEEILKKVIHKT